MLEIREVRNGWYGGEGRMRCDTGLGGEVHRKVRR